MRLSAAKDLEEMLQVAVETLTEEMNANQVSMWLVNWDSYSFDQETGAPDNRSKSPWQPEQSWSSGLGLLLLEVVCRELGSRRPVMPAKAGNQTQRPVARRRRSLRPMILGGVLSKGLRLLAGHGFLPSQE
jgi:hypothetical protein